MNSGNPQVTPDLRSHLEARFRQPLMTFFLRRIKNRVDAEDLTQETLMRVLAAADVARIENAEGFVFKIAMNLVHDRNRKAIRNGAPVFVPIDQALASELERQLVENISPERFFLSNETLIEALQRLQELGERTYNIFILFRLENMRQKDIAALYGISQSTVEKHVMKAVLHLATRYGGGLAP